MVAYKTGRSTVGLHLGTDKSSSGWASPKYWYEQNFDEGTLNFSFGDFLTKEILFDHPLHSWDEKTW